MNESKWLAMFVLGTSVACATLPKEKSWSDREAELTAAISKGFLETGAPSKEIADTAASCLASILVETATEAKCPAEGVDVVVAMKSCVRASQQVKVAVQYALPACIAQAEAGK